MRKIALIGSALALLGVPVSGDGMDPCAFLPFLKRYFMIGVVERPADDLLALDLVANLHSADCGGPDCYGTYLRLELHLESVGGRCAIRRAMLSSEGFAGSGCEDVQIEGERSSEVEVELEEVDLADPRTSAITFRDGPEGRALVLLPTDFYYFDHVEPGGELWTHLFVGSGDPAELRCCWGASSSAFVKFSMPEVDPSEGHR